MNAITTNSVILQLEARIGEYDRQVANSADATERAMQRINTAATDTERVLGQNRIGMQQLSMQLGDMATMYALGARPMQIFASQSGQVLQAVQLMAGGTSRFAMFLSGPWGLAISTALIALTPLVAKMFEGEQAADAMREAEANLANSMTELADSRAALDEALGRNIGQYRELRVAAIQAAMAEVEAARTALDARRAALREEREYGQVAGNLRGRRDAASQQSAAALAMFGFGDTSQEVVDVVNATADLNRRTADLNNATARLVQLMNGGGGSTAGGASAGGSRSRPAAAIPEEQGSSREDQEQHQRAVRKAREADELEADRIRNQKLEEQRSAENLRNRNKEEAEILHRARLEAEEAAQRVREENVHELADMYQTLFTDGVGGVWRKFRQEGLAAIAMIAAQWTVAMATGGSTDLGGIARGVFGQGGLLSSLGGLFGGPRAMGGPVSTGKAYLVGERGPELFMPQSHGTIIPNQALTTPAQAGGGVATVRLMLSGDIDARIARISGPVAVEVVRGTAGEVVERAVQEVGRRSGRRTL